MQVNNVNSNQNFGMAMFIRHDAQKILAKKIKSEKDIQLLDSLVKAQTNNPFTVDLRVESGKFKTYISDSTEGAKRQLTTLEQSIFEKWFKSPVAFIERCCKKADKMNEETYAPNMNPKLKEIFEKAYI